jgi:glutaredoxin
MMTLYSKPNCVYCDKVKNFIKNNDITNVAFDESANVEKVRSMGGMQFPMLLIKNDDGTEQGIFESEVIMQVIAQMQ